MTSPAEDTDDRDLVWLIGIPEAERDVARAEVNHERALRIAAEAERDAARAEAAVLRRRYADLESADDEAVSWRAAVIELEKRRQSESAAAQTQIDNWIQQVLDLEIEADRLRALAAGPALVTCAARCEGTATFCMPCPHCEWTTPPLPYDTSGDEVARQFRHLTDHVAATHEMTVL